MDRRVNGSGSVSEARALAELRRRLGVGIPLSRAPALALALLCVALIGIIELAAGHKVALAILYVFPIAFAALYAGGRAAFLVALASGAAWLLAELGAAGLTSARPAVFWNAAVLLGFFLAIAFLLDRLVRTITQLDASRAANRAGEERFRGVFDHASDGIFIADLEGRYIDVNEAGCRLLGYGRGELIDMSIGDLVPPADRERLRQSKERLLKDGPGIAEWSLRHKDGHYVAVEASSTITADGRWIALVRDITERKRVQESTRAAAAELEARVAERTAQLRALASELAAAEDRERREIARDLHDDLGQILAAARIRLASLRAASGPDCAQAADEIDRLIARADHATRSLAAQLAPPVLYELGLVPALEWLVEELQDTYGLKVELIDDGAPKPLTQPARAILYRAVRELLINVAKHAEVGAAEVETTRRGDRLHVRVNDHGVGFDQEKMARAPRRGLGLASVRERLSYIDGTVDIRSVPGDGTVVELTAPLAAQTQPSAEAPR